MDADQDRYEYGFMPLEPTALRLGIPKSYLRERVNRGELPHLQIGKRFLFNLRDVGEALRCEARTLAWKSSDSHKKRKRTGSSENAKHETAAAISVMIRAAEACVAADRYLKETL